MGHDVGEEFEAHGTAPLGECCDGCIGIVCANEDVAGAEQVPNPRAAVDSGHDFADHGMAKVLSDCCVLLLAADALAVSGIVLVHQCTI